MREICFDTETTGIDPFDGHKIIEIGCVEIIDGVKTGNTYHSYINPERDVPKEAYNIHGINTNFLLDKPIFASIANDFLSFVKDSRLIAHNAAFDMKFLNFELRKVSLEIIERRHILDFLQIARKRFPGVSNSLDALCKRLGVSLSKRDKHGALIDAELLAECYLILTGSTGQVSLFKKQSNNKKHNEFSQEKSVIPPRNFRLTAEELKLHREFILKNIKSNLWGYE